MRHLPIIKYSGLTIVLSEASRFDKKQLLSGFVGQSFEGFLNPISRFACDIRTINNSEPFIENTKVCLLLGAKAQQNFFPGDLTLNEQRGSPQIKNEIIFISTYSPQDAFDRQNYNKEEAEGDAEICPVQAEQTGINRGTVYGVHEI